MEFRWSPGFAASQKRKNVEALHDAAKLRGVAKSILEVSTRSLETLGIKLSAFNLQIELPGRSNPVSVEAAFQSSKVFDRAGLQSHLLELTDGREIKGHIRSLGDQELIGFEYLSETWPLDPPTAMYDYIYLQAITQLVSQQPEVGDQLAAFEAFTDIEFNPKKSLSCQARTCALFIGLGGLKPVQQLLADPSAFRAHLVKHRYGPKSPLPEPAHDTLFKDL